MCGSCGVSQHSVYLGIGIGRELLKHFHNFVLA